MGPNFVLVVDVLKLLFERAAFRLNTPLKPCSEGSAALCGGFPGSFRRWATKPAPSPVYFPGAWQFSRMILDFAAQKEASREEIRAARRPADAIRRHPAQRWRFQLLGGAPRRDGRVAQRPIFLGNPGSFALSMADVRGAAREGDGNLRENVTPSHISSVV